MKKFNSKEVSYIQDRASERITEIFDALGIEYDIRNDYIQCACPVHAGDNPRAFYWAMQTSHWKCTTRQCQEDPVTGPSSSVFGLVRGAMGTKTENRWSFQQSVLYIAKVLNLCDIKMDADTYDDIEVTKAIKRYKQRRKLDIKSDLTLLSDVIPKLKPDTTYYPKRGVSENTIAKYHISFCDDPKKPFCNRAFFPILDITGRYIVGWSGRSMWEKCETCNVYHKPKTYCPEGKEKIKCGKWKHSQGFKSENCLYNYWFAHPFIAKTGTAIVCESPGNCWALDHCGIKNSVGIFGLNMSKKQRLLLQKAGALTLVFALDNDDAGQKAIKKLKEQLNYYFRLFFITPTDKNDIADMLPSDIKKQFGDILSKWSRENLLTS